MAMQDERCAKYVGKLAIVPLTCGRHVPIIADKVSTNMLCFATLNTDARPEKVLMCCVHVGSVVCYVLFPWVPAFVLIVSCGDVLLPYIRIVLLGKNN
jgi:hypothetical protein